MKTNLASVLILIIAVQISCKPEKAQIISYEEAIKLCLPDTIVQPETSGGTMITFNYYRSSCILGAQIPEFSATTMDGVVIDSSYYKGKVTVLNFWFIGCKPCEKEMPGFNEIVDQYKGKPVNFLAISNNSPKDINEFLLRKPFNFQQVPYGEQIYRGNFQSKWGYPMTIIIDQQMKIINVFSMGMDGKENEIVAAIDNAIRL